jgi:hypothetical protein
MNIETPLLTTGWNRFRDFLDVKDDHIEVLFVYYGGINFSMHVKPISNLYQSDINIILCMDNLMIRLSLILLFL